MSQAGISGGIEDENMINVKGAKYRCGCVCGSDRPVPMWSIPKKCVTHGQEISFYFSAPKKDEKPYIIDPELEMREDNITPDKKLIRKHFKKIKKLLKKDKNTISFFISRPEKINKIIPVLNKFGFIKYFRIIKK